MVPNLEPSEPLSQVVFIHDYLQLIFQDERFNIYNVAEVNREGISIPQGEAGFCDAVVSLIGQRVTRVSRSDTHVLSLRFEQGMQFIVRGDKASARGPEAFQYNGKDQPVVVERRAGDCER